MPLIWLGIHADATRLILSRGGEAIGEPGAARELAALARVRRLDPLARGLAKEVVLWKEYNDPLLYLERRAYLGAIRDALAGVEAARVVLAKARQRLEEEREQRSP
jgi:hypothetical protein